jgi:beta-glucosidase
VELSLWVCNQGDMEAAEVVQVYLEPPGKLLERPRRSLVAFVRIVLQAGERRHLVLTIAPRQLACFDPVRDGFLLEGGLHRLVVSRHVEDRGQAVSIELPLWELGP